jgi:glyoxylase-like metal-dependent hydrolase (beta-lactamase superfamily II)
VSSEVFPFKVGNFECMAVSDGTMTYAPPNFPPPATFLFTNASGEKLEKALREHDIQPENWAEWVSPYISLVVKTGSQLVLVDTGISSFVPTTGRLIPNLKAGGITPEDIDTVILTHGHPDHIGGNVDSEGKPAFRNARYVMLRDEWDFWTGGKAEQSLAEHTRETIMKFARENLPPIKEQLDLVDDGAEIVSGIRAVAAPGHTPGHTVLSITSEGEQLLCTSDLVLHPIHLEHPEWFAAVDILPEQVAATRRRLLERAASDKALVIAFHFPFPGLGHIVPKGDVWQWRPL